jgi:hypothetical protein
MYDISSLRAVFLVIWHREEERAMELTTSRAVELFLASLHTRSAPPNTIKAGIVSFAKGGENRKKGKKES